MWECVYTHACIPEKRCDRGGICRFPLITACVCVLRYHIVLLISLVGNYFARHSSEFNPVTYVTVCVCVCVCVCCVESVSIPVLGELRDSVF